MHMLEQFPYKLPPFVIQNIKMSIRPMVHMRFSYNYVYQDRNKVFGSTKCSTSDLSERWPAIEPQLWKSRYFGFSVNDLHNLLNCHHTMWNVNVHNSKYLFMNIDTKSNEMPMLIHFKSSTFLKKKWPNVHMSICPKRYKMAIWKKFDWHLFDKQKHICHLHFISVPYSINCEQKKIEQKISHWVSSMLENASALLCWQ